MKLIAKHYDIKHSPFKMRVVANQVKSLPLERAQQVLTLSTKKASGYILKVLNSAIANAKNNFKISQSDLRIGEIQVGGGRIARKNKPRGRGRADVMRSQFSNLRIVLEAKPEKVIKKEATVEVKKDKSIKKAAPTTKTKKKLVTKTK